MVGHQAVGVDDPVEPSLNTPEHVEKHPPVAERPKDVLASLATRRDVVERPGKFQSQWPSYGHKVSFEGE